MAMIINVTQEELRSTATKIEGLAEEYKTLYTDKLLGANLGDLADAWYGEDHSSYDERVRGFKSNFNEMYNLMLEYVAHLRKAADEYDMNQDSLRDRARNI